MVPNKNQNFTFVKNNIEIVTQSFKSTVFSFSNETKSRKASNWTDTKFSTSIADFHKMINFSYSNTTTQFFTVEVNVSSKILLTNKSTEVSKTVVETRDKYTDLSYNVTPILTLNNTEAVHVIPISFFNNSTLIYKENNNKSSPTFFSVAPNHNTTVLQLLAKSTSTNFYSFHDRISKTNLNATSVFDAITIGSFKTNSTSHNETKFEALKSLVTTSANFIFTNTRFILQDFIKISKTTKCFNALNELVNTTFISNICTNLITSTENSKKQLDLTISTSLDTPNIITNKTSKKYVLVTYKSLNASAKFLNESGTLHSSVSSIFSTSISTTDRLIYFFIFNKH